MKYRVLILAVVVCILTVGAISAADESEQPLRELQRSLLFPTNADVAAGKTLAAGACSSCHSLDGISIDPALPHLAGQHVVYLYNELNAYKSGGRDDESMSSATRFLSDEALLKVSVYYASLAPASVALSVITADGSEPATEVVADDPVQKGQAAAAGCAGCHGAGGNSQIPGMPNLTAQAPEYFAVAMRDYKGGHRLGSMMSAMVASIDEATIKNLGLYYALQEPHRTTMGGTGDVDVGRSAAESCAICHGADGNTTAPDMPTLAGQDALYLASALKAYANGQRDYAQMLDATSKLSDAEIDALASFYAQQEPLARKVHRPPTVAQWIERCDRCHGVGGNSPNPSYPSLASQHETYLARVIETYASGGRHNSTMNAMSQPLNASDIKALAAHYASQPRKSILYVELPCTPDTKK